MPFGAGAGCEVDVRPNRRFDVGLVDDGDGVRVVALVPAHPDRPAWEPAGQDVPGSGEVVVGHDPEQVLSFRAVGQHHVRGERVGALEPLRGVLRADLDPGRRRLVGRQRHGCAHQPELDGVVVGGDEEPAAVGTGVLTAIHHAPTPATDRERHQLGRMGVDDPGLTGVAGLAPDDHQVAAA